MMGDAVNLAARTEAAGKVYGVPIVVTDATKEEAAAAGDACLFRALDTVILPGKTRAVHLYELMGLTEELPDSAHECANLYEKALKAYKKRHWAEALKLLEASASLEPHKPSRLHGITLNPSLVLKARVIKYKAKPPATTWKGIFTV